MDTKKPAEPVLKSFFRTQGIFLEILRRTRPRLLGWSDPKAPPAENLRIYRETARRASL